MQGMRFAKLFCLLKETAQGRCSIKKAVLRMDMEMNEIHCTFLVEDSMEKPVFSALTKLIGTGAYNPGVDIGKNNIKLMLQEDCPRGLANYSGTYDRYFHAPDILQNIMDALTSLSVIIFRGYK